MTLAVTAHETQSYQARRGELRDYFDRTALEAWARLMSDAPVGRIRATVRAGRDAMRATLLGWLPQELGGRRLLDAGCGTGLLSVEAARRGAEVTGVDISPSLIRLGIERAPADLGQGTLSLVVGDMLDEAFGRFDHIVVMDALIHYGPADVIAALARLAPRAHRSILFTFPPRTPALAAMHGVGRLFPRPSRAPAIQPVGEAELRRRIAAEPMLEAFQIGRTHRVASGFYTSQALELVRR